MYQLINCKTLKIISEKSIDGFNVTIPHKERIIPYLDDINEQAKSVGAVNTVFN